MYNYPYDMFNQNYMSAFDQQQYDAQKQHIEQLENINDLQKAASDLLDALDKVKPGYRQYAQQAVLNAVFQHKMKQAMGGTR